MNQWWRTQVSIYLPFHLFLIMAGMAFFLLEENTAPQTVLNTELQELTYRRQTPQGQQLQLDARHAEQHAGGAIDIVDLQLAVELNENGNAVFIGASGVVDEKFNAITINKVSGQLLFITPSNTSPALNSAHVSLETMTYHISNGRIEGKHAQIQNDTNEASGETFSLHNNTITLEGNIQATYHLPPL